jgi:succinate dehydrogenase flavin-adding protein (antitoxin of CptAB toxin-antitoxin module)
MDGINYMHKWDSQLSLDEYLFEHFDGLSDAEINDIKTLLDKFDNL